MRKVKSYKRFAKLNQLTRKTKAVDMGSHSFADSAIFGRPRAKRVFQAELLGNFLPPCIAAVGLAASYGGLMVLPQLGVKAIRRPS
jgi:hypothetical protein